MPDAPLLRPQARPTGDAQARPARRPEELGAASAHVAQAATRADALPLDRTALVGLFHKPEGASALLRLPGGTLVRAVAGTPVGGARVVAILRDGVRLRQGGEDVVLTLPG